MIPARPTRPPSALVLALVLVLVAETSTPAHGDDLRRAPTDLPSSHIDADIAREAVRRGEFLSLNQILAIIARDHPGQILEIELEREDGFWEYEVEIITPGGRVVEITLDPATGRIRDYGDDDD